MVVFAIGVKYSLDLSVERPHHPNTREHRWPTPRISASIAACHSAVACSAFGSFDGVIAGILQGDEPAAAGQRYGILEAPSPSFIGLQ
jgi:hypothetical protein